LNALMSVYPGQVQSGPLLVTVFEVRKSRCVIRLYLHLYIWDL
jgi:hypothetical protein